MEEPEVCFSYNSSCPHNSLSPPPSQPPSLYVCVCDMESLGMITESGPQNRLGSVALWLLWISMNLGRNRL